jgi:pimeloyl-ACP methyl ester carboxylesterase
MMRHPPHEGSQLQAALVHAQAAAAGLALVAFDRPGFGGSSPDPRATIGSIAGDVADLADQLGHQRFVVNRFAECAGLVTAAI